MVGGTKILDAIRAGGELSSSTMSSSGSKTSTKPASRFSLTVSTETDRCGFAGVGAERWSSSLRSESNDSAAGCEPMSEGGLCHPASDSDAASSSDS